MNRPLRRVSFGVLVLLGLLLANLTYLQAIQAEALNNRPGNTRVTVEEYSRKRGTILVAGKAIAESRETEGRLKYKRRYPEGKDYAPATGHLSLVTEAKGAEKAANGFLAGTDGRLAIRRVFDLFAGEEARGGNVSLTLNPKAQQAAVEGLRGKRGAVVALDPSTGAILAMASSPSYDPNLLAGHDREEALRSYQELEKDPDDPLINRAVEALYPPGSTFKLVTAAAALSSGRYDPDSKLPGPARLDLPQTRATLPNYDGRPCNPGGGQTTLVQALRRSCNTTFGQLGLDLGNDALREQAQKFGFGDPFHVPMRSAVSVVPPDLDKPALAQSAIGQRDVRATPLQMAVVAAAIANNGVVMQPYLIDQYLAPDLSVLERTEPEKLSTAVSPEVAQQLTDMMVAVVEDPEGTGHNGRIPGVRVAGKTGTAQDGERAPHVWFVSFAPADPGQDAKVAVAVVVENRGGQSEGGGNAIAAPIARDVMQAVLE